MLELVRVTDRVHVVPTWIALSPGFWLPLRSTVLTLSGGGLAIVSPVAFDDAVAARIDALGPVELLVAPSKLHHLHVAAAHARWPKARVHAVAGLREKRRDLHIDAEIEGERALDADLLAIPIEGVPSFGEHVFLHRPSRTLVVTDLVFHVQASRGWLTPLVLRMMGAPRGTLGQSRAWRWAAKDRGALAASLRRVLALDFDRLVVAHGEVIETGAKAALERAMAKNLGHAPLALPRASGA
jgi:hypothetical protein